MTIHGSIETVYQKEQKTTEIVEDTIVSCLGCNIQLVQCIITKQSDTINAIQAVCPKCGERTFIKKIKGTGYIGACSDKFIISDIKCNPDDNDPMILNTLVELING